MKKRRLGHSDLYVTEIGLGTNAVGGHNLYENLSEEVGMALVRRAVEVGISFIDTADIYGHGRSEELVGQALGAGINDVIIATKGGHEWDPADPSKVRINNHPEFLRAALEASLRRLGREYVDLYYIHKIDDDVPVCDSYGELMKLREEGKIRAAGLSNVLVPHIQAAMCAGPVDAVQNQYNLLMREPEDEVTPFCEDNDIAFIPYGPIAYGILGGTYGPDLQLAPGDWRNGVPLFSEKNYGSVLSIVEGLKKIAAELNVPLPHLAMRWVLRRSFVASTITGAKRPEQVEANARAVGWDLDRDTLDRINELTARVRFH
ncbi:MAG: aldo/keto reductase [Candidatus Lernaella stagnicola]|nr:aldo/keto reductase [Candidatus Lernaella stagnicola]